MLPRERELVKKLADQPFTLLGVNCEQSRSALQKLIKDEKINWPNIYDGRSNGPMVTRWNIRAFPTIFVIDPAGVIRARDLPSDQLEKVVKDLLKKTK